MSATPTKCPFASGFHKDMSKGTTNKEWWPEQLDLKVLRQNSPQSDPMGGGFDYAKEFKGLDLHAAVVPVGNYASLLELNRRFTHPSARRVLLQPIARAAPAGSAPGSPQGEAAGRGQ